MHRIYLISYKYEHTKVKAVRYTVKCGLQYIAKRRGTDTEVGTEEHGALSPELGLGSREPGEPGGIPPYGEKSELRFRI